MHFSLYTLHLSATLFRMDPIIKKTEEELHGERSAREALREGERFPVILFCENIRSLYNVGSLFRTCDGARVRSLYLCGYTGYPPRKEIDKTALGSVDTVPWVHNTDPVAALRRLKDEGYQVVALEHTHASVPYTEAVYTFPLCLVLGNEVEGVTQELLDLCDMAVEIPMYGSKESLNVSVAGGIALYHLVDVYLRGMVTVRPR